MSGQYLHFDIKRFCSRNSGVVGVESYSVTQPNLDDDLVTHNLVTHNLVIRDLVTHNLVTRDLVTQTEKNNSLLY